MKQLIYEFLSPFHKTYDHKIWQAVTSREVDSSETNQAGAGDAIMSRSRDKLERLYLHYKGAYGYQTRRDSNLP